MVDSLDTKRSFNNCLALVDCLHSQQQQRIKNVDRFFKTARLVRAELHRHMRANSDKCQVARGPLDRLVVGPVLE